VGIMGEEKEKIVLSKVLSDDTTKISVGLFDITIHL
jgi:hypothetical protein